MVALNARALGRFTKDEGPRGESEWGAKAGEQLVFWARYQADLHVIRDSLCLAFTVPGGEQQFRERCRCDTQQVHWLTREGPRRVRQNTGPGLKQAQSLRLNVKAP